MDINFEYYKIFYYVAKYCNFTKAARALGNSQPNVTRAMNNLEQQINSILFIRNNRGVQLTPEESVCTRMYLQRCHRYLRRRRSCQTAQDCHTEAYQ